MKKDKERCVGYDEVSRILRGIPIGVEGCAGLVPTKPHTRIQDDHEGTFQGRITVGIGVDGDAWIQQDNCQPIRFRNMMGGGLSPRTYTALIILAKAIEADQEADLKRGVNYLEMAAKSDADGPEDSMPVGTGRWYQTPLKT